MRDVMFRGKARMSIEELDELEIIHEDGWVFGNYIENGFSPYIVGDLADVGNDYIAHEWWVEVIPESVGRWTGLKDKDDKEIYEGDLIKKKFKDRKIGDFYAVGQVVFSRWYAGFTVPYKYHGYTNLERLSSDVDKDGWIVANQKMDVIGNIYENPELLEGATNGSS